MPKQLTEPEKSALARPDRDVVQARKEAGQRVEELKLKLIMLVDRHFEQSLRIIKRWMRDDEKDAAPKKR
jgi:aromatic ring-opening dioxygenase catalytic subunit (LigB family)